MNPQAYAAREEPDFVEPAPDFSVLDDLMQTATRTENILKTIAAQNAATQLVKVKKAYNTLGPVQSSPWCVHFRLHVRNLYASFGAQSSLPWSPLA